MKSNNSIGKITETNFAMLNEDRKKELKKRDELKKRSLTWKPGNIDPKYIRTFKPEQPKQG